MQLTKLEEKLSNITPILKKEDTTLKENLFIYVGKTQNQNSAYGKQFMSPFLCDYTEGINTQHALIATIEKWKFLLDKKEYTGAILMDRDVEELS